MSTQPSTPTDDAQTPPVDTPAPEPITLPETEVEFRQLVTTLTRNDDGTPKDLVLPEGTDKATKLAINAEISRRSTQAQHTKVAQELALERKKLDASTQLALKGAKGSFTEAELAELEELKATDIDAWRVRYSELEKARDTRANEAVTKAMEVDPSTVANVAYAEQLKSFNATLGEPITQEELDNELPPKYIKAVRDNVLTYEDYLLKARELLRPTKEVTTSRVPKDVEPPRSNPPSTPSTYNILEDEDFVL